MSELPKINTTTESLANPEGPEEGLTSDEVLKLFNGGGMTEDGPKAIFSGDTKAGSRLAKPEKKSIGERLKQLRKEAGYVGKHVMKAAETRKAEGPSREDEDADEAALEAAFREVTIDEVLAEGGPEQKTSAELTAEKLGSVRLAEVIIGAINESREQEGNYYDYLQMQADNNEVPYDDLLQLVRERVKSGYDDRKAKIKFYHSLSRKDFVKAAEAGKLQRSDARETGADHRASDLRFSQDLMADAEVSWTGFADEQSEDPDEVMLVFGGDLVDQKSFDPMIMGVDETDLQGQCVAIVAAKPKGLAGILAANDLAIPVYAMGEGAESWSRKSRDVDQLREKKAKLVDKHEREAELRRESLSDVNVEKARERMEKLAERITPEDWDEVFERFQQCETDAEYVAAERETFTMFLDRLGVKGASEVRYLSEDEPQKNYLTVADDGEGYRMWLATLSRRTVPLGSMSRSVKVLSHEAGHAWEISLIDRLDAGDELSAKEHELAELYKYNLKHFIPAEVDLANYNKQILEIDATELGESCLDAFYKRYEEKHKTPLQKVIDGLQELLKRPEAHTEGKE